MEPSLTDRSGPSTGLGPWTELKSLACVLAVLAILPLLILYLDGSVRTFILSVQSRSGLAVASWVSAAGSGLTGAIVAASLLAVGLILGRPKEAMAGRLGLFAVILGGIAVQVPKHLFCRYRPLAEGAGRFFVASPCIGDGYLVKSFPSGHAMTAFAVAYVLARTFPKGSPAFYTLAVMVALSRVYLGSHFLSDIVAGAMIGLFAGWIVCRLAIFRFGDARS